MTTVVEKKMNLKINDYYISFYSNTTNMGIFFSIFKRLQDKRILLLGLDAAGKTTILYKLHMGDIITTIPTIGFNVEEVIYRSLRMTMWDVGGQDKIRPLWRHYYQGSNALIYVVDACDHDRITEAKKELYGILADGNLQDIPILILANKSDLMHALSVSEITRLFDLQAMRDHSWYVQASSAISGEGLYEGLDWLSQMLSKQRK